MEAVEKGELIDINVLLEAVEKGELPMAFVAFTYAKTPDPTARLKGSACKTEMGTVQLTAVPEQPAYAKYVTPSLF